jgi:hypothetical protein
MLIVIWVGAQAGEAYVNSCLDLDGGACPLSRTSPPPACLLPSSPEAGWPRQPANRPYRRPMAPSRASSFLLILLLALPELAPATGVFQVRRKFPRHAAAGLEEEAEGHLKELRRHDVRRHDRRLGAVALPLGGIGLPTDTG